MTGIHSHPAHDIQGVASDQHGHPDLDRAAEWAVKDIALLADEVRNLRRELRDACQRIGKLEGGAA